MPDSKIKTYALHIVLFLVTLITTTLAGAEWTTGRSFVHSFLMGSNDMGWPEFTVGFLYSIPFLGILTAHEFGHYLTARFYDVNVSLPYYIPIWFGGGPSIGTMGAFIRIQSALHTRQQFFDIGIAGPLAGFILAIGVLWYGFTHLPPPEYIFVIHPTYAQYGLDYPKYVYSAQSGNLALGSNLIFEFFKHFVVDDPSRIPNPYEIIHYPFLMAGYFALFFTGLNLLPIGQLDGGHILYGLIGFRKHAIVSPILFGLFVFYAGLGAISPDRVLLLFFEFPLYLGIPVYLTFLYLLFFRITDNPKSTIVISLAVAAGQFGIPLFFDVEGYQGWFVFAFILGRFLGVYHPPALYDEPLDGKRRLLGWLTLLIFIGCFSPQPFIFEEVATAVGK